MLYIGETSSSLCGRGSSSTSAGGSSFESTSFALEDDAALLLRIDMAGPPARCVYAK